MLTSARRLALLALLAAFAVSGAACHKHHCRDDDRRYLDKECR